MALHKRISEELSSDILKVTVIEGFLPHVIEKLYIIAIMSLLALGVLLLRHKQRLAFNEKKKRCPECGRPWDGQCAEEVG